jgi:5-formyltetrahydrofolate cyclo-ligase
MSWIVGVGLKEQIVESVPTTDTDWSLDVLVLGDGKVILREKP